MQFLSEFAAAPTFSIGEEDIQSQVRFFKGKMSRKCKSNEKSTFLFVSAGGAIISERSEDVHP